MSGDIRIGDTVGPECFGGSDYLDFRLGDTGAPTRTNGEDRREYRASRIADASAPAPVPSGVHDAVVAGLKKTIAELQAQVCAADTARDTTRAEMVKAGRIALALDEERGALDTEARRLSDCLATTSRKCDLLMAALERHEDAVAASMAYLGCVEMPNDEAGPLEREMVARRLKRALRQCQRAQATPLDDPPADVVDEDDS